MNYIICRGLIKIFILTLLSTISFSARYPVIIDHDGGVDDILSLMLVAASDDIDIKAVLITPADSWLAPTVDITRSLVRRMGLSSTTIVSSHHEGKNKFPVLWRNYSYKMLSIDAFLPLITLDDDIYYEKLPAKDKLITLLSNNEQFDLLITGPMSNLAEALTYSPEIAKNIHAVYFMGGAFNVDGNVDLENSRRVSEWNVYNNPEAVNTVLSHQVPVIFIPLDATNKAPVTSSFIRKLNQQKEYDLSDTALQLLKIISPQIGYDHYQKHCFFWDVLTAAVLLDDSVIKTQKIHTKVITSGALEGKTVLLDDGYLAKMAFDIDLDRLERLLLNKYRQNFKSINVSSTQSLSVINE